jgi:hypothetical protein
VPAPPSHILEPLWFQVAALLPTGQVHCALGCHRPRIPNQLIFDKLVQVLVFGAPADEWAGVNLARLPAAISLRPGERERPRAAAGHRQARQPPAGA